jgi:sulfotransferase 6B1
MKNSFYIILAVFYGQTLGAFVNPPQQIVAISIPKCGTHLLAKCLLQMTHRTNYVTYGPDDTKYEREKLLNGRHHTVTQDDFMHLTHLPHSTFWVSHLLPLPEYREILRDAGKFSVFFIYRDPRDQLVSHVHYIRKRRNKNSPIFNDIVDTMSNDELLTALIKGCPLRCSDNETNTHIITSGVNTYYRTYLTWLDLPEVCAIRFEDLIGPRGGGSHEALCTTLERMSHHMRITLTEREMNKIMSQLFGNSPTFHEGKIGSWKKTFTEEHKRIFKEYAGQLLIDLGYETDYNW